MYNRRLLAILSVLLLFGTGQVFAQIAFTTGSIYGTVTGEDQKPLPGVTVTLEPEGAVPKVATTGAGGSYRFAGLVPGMYNVAFDLSGFTQIRQEGIQITSGKNVELEVVMRQTAEEVMIVSGAPPLVDRKKTQVSSSYDQAYMEAIPTGRDPWVILDQTPGIDVDRINVGGNTSGQQAIFSAKGGSFADNGWSYDGVDITDPAALGGTPTYYDFDSFQEIQITTGGQDPAIGTGGIVINLVTKRGGNSWSGQASGYYDNDSLQGDNSSDELAAQRFILPSRVDQVYEYGGDLGGPIVQDRLWVWGAYRKQIIDTFTATTLSAGGATLGADPQHVELEDINLKGNWAYNAENEGNFQYLYGKKIFDGRYAFPTTNQGPETTWAQDGPTKMYKAEHSWIPSSNLFFDAKYAHVDGAFNLLEQTGKPPVLRLHEDFFLEQGGIGNYVTLRPTHNVTVDVNWFKQNWAGGDHEFKFGMNLRKADVTTSSFYAGDILIYDYGLTGRTGPSGPLGHGKAKIRYDLLPKYALPLLGFYAGDTWRMDRLTLNLGFNYSHLTSENKAVDVPANEFAPDLLPAVSFPGNEGPTFNNFSPRVGGTYDLTGEGNALIRASYARFYGGVGPAPLGFINPLGGYAGIYIGFQDLNGDGIATRNEIGEDLGYIYYYEGPGDYYADYPVFYGFGGFDPANPGAFISNFPNARFIADDFKANRTEEFLAGVDFQVGTNATVAVNYSYRKYDRLWNTDLNDLATGFRPGVTSDDFTCTPLTTTVRGETFTYQFCDISAAQAAQLGDVFFLGNVDGYTRDYHGVELTFNKRMSDNWMFRASGDIKTQKIHFDGANSFQDPTQIPFIDDTWWAEQSTGSGSGGTFTGSRWGLKLSGAYQFPGDFTVGAYAKILDGNVVPQVRANLGQNYANGTPTFVVAPFDQRRLDTVMYMDLRIEKGFAMGPYGRLAATMDVFNLFNTNEILRVERRVTQSTFGFAADAVSPRIVRFGARYTF